jgi:hypothetical protein
METETQSARPASAAPAARAPWSVWLYVLFSWLLGWWLVLDGLRQRVLGDYARIDGRLGPWADLATAAGIDPQRLGMAFVALGFGLIGASFGVLLRRRWGFGAALFTAAAGLLYLGFGTPAAFLCLVCLLLKPTREYLLGPRPG